MKIFLLAADFPPSVGGIQTLLYELCRRLPPKDLCVLVPDAPGAALFDRGQPFTVLRLRRGSSRGFGRLLLTGWWTLIVCGRFRPDLLVAGHIIMAPVALLVRMILGTPYVLFTYAYEIRRKRWRWLMKLVARHAASVVAISRYTRQAAEDLDVPPARLRILHPGVDLARFAAVEGGREGKRRPSGQIILSVGRLNERYKGEDTVIRALPLIRAKCPTVKYYLVGDGWLREYLQRLARAIGVEADVVFLGAVTDDRLLELYRECDVFVQVSRESRTGGGAEGFGIVCLEAGAAGKPVVAGNSGGLPDAVLDGVTGLLVDPNDPGECAEAVVTLLKGRAFAEELGQNGRARALRELTWDHMATAARTIFQDAIAVRAATSAPPINPRRG